jgi:hypothetical protein
MTINLPKPLASGLIAAEGYRDGQMVASARLTLP